MSERTRAPHGGADRLNAAALHVFPDLIHPEDEEMRSVCGVAC